MTFQLDNSKTGPRGPLTTSTDPRQAVQRWGGPAAIVSFLLVIAVAISSGPAQAAGFKPPQECEAYTGEAHLNCLYAYIELQQSQLGRIEEDLKAQNRKLRDLSDKVESNTRAPGIEKAAPLPPDPVYVPVPSPVPSYAYPPYYAYPPFGYYAPFGFSLFLGPRYGYGPRYFGPRYYGGPRFYGPGGGRWGRR
jgi:hypothetical protein